MSDIEEWILPRKAVWYYKSSPWPLLPNKHRQPKQKIDRRLNARQKFIKLGG
jgi:hypothetical protein